MFQFTTHLERKTQLYTIFPPPKRQNLTPCWVEVKSILPAHTLQADNEGPEINLTFPWITGCV